MLSVSASMSKGKERKAVERRHTYGNEVPAMGPERFREFGLDGVEEMGERFPFSCHVCGRG